MKVVVVIPIFNGLDDTLECLESLFADDPGQAVVLSDDASTDGSSKAIGDRYASVEVVRRDTNGGFGAAANDGLRRAFASGASMAFLVNNDTLFTPGLLEQLVACSREHPEAGLIAPVILEHPSGAVWSAGGVCRLEEGSAENLTEVASGEPYETDWLTGCAYLMAKEAFERTGGLDESFYMYGEDLDFSLRIRKAGFALLVEPRATLHHKVSRFFSLLSPEKHYYKVRNLLEIMQRNLNASEFKAARDKLRRRALVRLLKDTYRHGGLGVQRFLAVRRAVRDQERRRFGRL